LPVEATSEVAAAAAAAAAAEQGQSQKPPSRTPSPLMSSPTSMPPPSSPARSPSRSASTSRSAAGELRDARRTLIERKEDLNRVSMRSRDMSNSASNFASAAQGFLELSQKKK